MLNNIVLEDLTLPNYKKVHYVNKFNYLGSIITPLLNEDTEIDTEIKSQVDNVCSKILNAGMIYSNKTGELLLSPCCTPVLYFISMVSFSSLHLTIQLLYIFLTTSTRKLSVPYFFRMKKRGGCCTGQKLLLSLQAMDRLAAHAVNEGTALS